MIITIDGPTASGKSSTARLVAQKLGYYHLNSGMLYRALAYLLTTKEQYLQETLSHPDYAHIQQYLDPHLLTYVWDSNGKTLIFFNQDNITSHLKTAYSDNAASVLSTNTAVRTAVNAYLNKLAQQYSLVADGRDCGSVVFPGAYLKFFLTAPLEVRAQRWRTYQQKQGNVYSLEQACATIAERDTRDMKRTIAPLVVPEGAVVIDNGALSPQQTVDRIVALAQKTKK